MFLCGREDCELLPNRIIYHPWSKLFLIIIIIYCQSYYFKFKNNEFILTNKCCVDVCMLYENAESSKLSKVVFKKYLTNYNLLFTLNKSKPSTSTSWICVNVTKLLNVIIYYSYYGNVRELATTAISIGSVL